MKLYRSFFTWLLAAIISFSFTIPVFQLNFSGTWALNEGKSELGQMARAAASKIVVDQKADGITTTRTTTGMNGTASDQKETLGNDGKETESTVFAGSGKRKATLKWSAGNNSFTIFANTSIERGGQSIDFKTTEVWFLSADGKTLTITYTISSPQGELTTKAVYDKQ